MRDMQVSQIEKTKYNDMEIKGKQTHTSQILADYHIHTHLSRDAPQATVAGYISEAEKKGVKEIAFTNHLILAGEDRSTGIRLDEINGHLEEIWLAQEDTDVLLKTGFEVDYFPDKERLITHVLDEYPLDYVLGSVHQVNGRSVYTGPGHRNRFFEGQRRVDAIEDYYRVTRMMVESGLFDCISHPDYFRKSYTGFIGWADYGNVVLDVIDAMRSYDVGFEINSSGYRHGVGDNFPCSEFIEAALGSGVSTVTLGSDSHICGTVGYRALESVLLLESMGQETVSTFVDRKEDRVSLDKMLQSVKGVELFDEY